MQTWLDRFWVCWIHKNSIFSLSCLGFLYTLSPRHWSCKEDWILSSLALFCLGFPSPHFFLFFIFIACLVCSLLEPKYGEILLLFLFLGLGIIYRVRTFVFWMLWTLWITYLIFFTSNLNPNVESKWILSVCKIIFFSSLTFYIGF